MTADRVESPHGSEGLIFNRFKSILARLVTFQDAARLDPTPARPRHKRRISE